MQTSTSASQTASDHRKTRTAAGPASRAAPPGLTGPPPGEAQPSLDPEAEMDERFKKCPWLFRKGNMTGQHRQRRSQLRLRMENRPPHVVRVDWPDRTNSLGIVRPQTEHSSR